MSKRATIATCLGVLGVLTDDLACYSDVEEQFKVIRKAYLRKVLQSHPGTHFCRLRVYAPFVFILVNTLPVFMICPPSSVYMRVQIRVATRPFSATRTLPSKFCGTSLRARKQRISP